MRGQARPVSELRIHWFPQLSAALLAACLICKLRTTRNGLTISEFQAMIVKSRSERGSARRVAGEKCMAEPPRPQPVARGGKTRFFQFFRLQPFEKPRFQKVKESEKNKKKAILLSFSFFFFRLHRRKFARRLHDGAAGHVAAAWPPAMSAHMAHRPMGRGRAIPATGSKALPPAAAARRPRSRPSFPGSTAPGRRRSSPPAGSRQRPRPGPSAPLRHRRRR